MFSFFKKDPIKKLKTKRKTILEKAMHVQRSGDLKGYAAMMEEVDRLDKELEELNTNE